MRKRIANHLPGPSLRSSAELKRLHEEAQAGRGIGRIRDLEEEARALVGKGERIPDHVQQTLSFFVRKKLWCVLSRNHEARSCRDAVHKRERLGRFGIPLEDELKSYFARYELSDTSSQYVIFHSRAHQLLDWDKIEVLLNDRFGVGTLTRLEEEELHMHFGMEYGRVNPFTLERSDVPVLQIFDVSTRLSTRAPFTMMTNAGEHTWAVEFRPSEIAEALEYATFHDICHTQTPAPPPHSIGIITGNTPESGLLLWNWINDEVRKQSGSHFYGDLSFPRVTIESVPALGVSIELDRREEETWHVLKDAVKSLCERGCTLLSLACNTAHYFTPQIRALCEKYGTTFVSMAEVTDTYLKTHQIEQFACLGIELVADIHGPWSAYHMLRDRDVEDLSSRAHERLYTLAHKVKAEGANESGLQLLRDILKNEVRSQHVVLAMTECSILLAHQKKRGKRKQLIEPLKLYAEAIAGLYLERAQCHLSTH